MTVPRFWREIPQRYNLQASSCEVCEGIYFPPREVCPQCRRASVGRMKGLKLAGRGLVVEFTRVHKPAPGYEFQVPYIVALIRTPEGPVLTGQIVDADPAAVRIGSAVRAVFRRIGQDGEAGVIHYGTKWLLDASAATDASTTRPTSGKGVGKAPRAGRTPWRKRSLQTT